MFFFPYAYIPIIWFKGFPLAYLPALLPLHFGAIAKQKRVEHKHCDPLTVELISKMATK